MNLRTDLAWEAHQLACTEGAALAGVKTARCRFGRLQGEEVEILDPRGEEATGKSRGRYLSLDVGKPWQDGEEQFREKVCSLAMALRELIPPGEGQILVCGLGNRFITADAVGPLTVEHLVVSSHVKEEKPGLFASLGMGEVCAIAPGVLGQTGMESAQILKSLACGIKPRLVVAVDALAARSLSRLASTVQLSDSGLAPGSGVGNRRMRVDRESMGCPVLAVGVPTVVDAATLVYDAAVAAGAEAEAERICRRLEQGEENLFVTPKESDSIMRSLGRLLGYALNVALHPAMDYDSMVSLAAC